MRWNGVTRHVRIPLVHGEDCHQYPRLVMPWRSVRKGHQSLSSKPTLRSILPCSLPGIAPRTGKERLRQLTVLGVTALLCLLIGFVAGNQHRQDAAQGIWPMPSQLEDGKQETQFILAVLHAQNVAILGDFNAWEPTALSDEAGNGIWSTSVLLTPGRYEYAFVIDGHWWGHDPLADEIVPSFGAYKSARYVRGGAAV